MILKEIEIEIALGIIVFWDEKMNHYRELSRSQQNFKGLRFFVKIISKMVSE